MSCSRHRRATRSSAQPQGRFGTVTGATTTTAGCTGTCTAPLGRYCAPGTGALTNCPAVRCRGNEGGGGRGDCSQDKSCWPRRVSSAGLLWSGGRAGRVHLQWCLSDWQVLAGGSHGVHQLRCGESPQASHALCPAPRRACYGVGSQGRYGAAVAMAVATCTAVCPAGQWSAAVSRRVMQADV
jgi:hypothetical protein